MGSCRPTHGFALPRHVIGMQQGTRAPNGWHLVGGKKRREKPHVRSISPSPLKPGLLGSCGLQRLFRFNFQDHTPNYNPDHLQEHKPDCLQDRNPRPNPRPDTHHHADMNPTHQGRRATALSAFLPSKNLGELFSKSPARSLGGLDGMRSFSMLWIILAHSSLFVSFQGTVNPAEEKDFIQSLPEQFVYSMSATFWLFSYRLGHLRSFPARIRLGARALLPITLDAEPKKNTRP